MREATSAQNKVNKKKKMLPGTASKFKGVSRSLSRWRAHINHAGKTHHIGTFNTEVEAHQAYVRAAKNMHGDFARFD